MLFFFQAEDGIRDLVRSRGLGDVYKRQDFIVTAPDYVAAKGMRMYGVPLRGDPYVISGESGACLLYTSDAADERSSVDLGGRRIIKKKYKKKKRESV